MLKYDLRSVAERSNSSADWREGRGSGGHILFMCFLQSKIARIPLGIWFQPAKILHIYLKMRHVGFFFLIGSVTSAYRPDCSTGLSTQVVGRASVSSEKPHLR